MSELIEAYGALTEDDGGGRYGDRRAGDSRVALACEALSVSELRSDRNHDVRSMRILMTTDGEGDGGEREQGERRGGRRREGPEAGDDEQSAVDREFPPVTDDGDGGGREGGGKGEDDDAVSPVPLVEVHSHPYDSVSDLKRHIQITYGEEWGLLTKSGRRRDRDGIVTGWELLVASSDGDGDDRVVLGNHLFLADYDVKGGDVIHAVVRRYDEVEAEVTPKSRPWRSEEEAEVSTSR